MSRATSARVMLTRDNFLGFDDGGNFYRRIKSKANDTRVRTFTEPMEAVTWVARSVGRSPGLKARTTDGDVPIFDGDGKLLPGMAKALRCLLNANEAALLDLFAGKGST